jgi:hypothetical protein
MRFRFRALAAPSLLLAAACSACSPSTPSDPGVPGQPRDPGSGQPGVPVDQAATSLGVTIMARDTRGVPRLIRSIVPRAGIAGAAPARSGRR